MMTYENFKAMLEKSGYQYGDDAASNAYVGYVLAQRPPSIADASEVLREAVRNGDPTAQSIARAMCKLLAKLVTDLEDLGA